MHLSVTRHLSVYQIAIFAGNVFELIHFNIESHFSASLCHKAFIGVSNSDFRCEHIRPDTLNIVTF